MRADRLIAALLVLQSKGKVTAAELAQELEVSERTARRDLEALAMSGVPVYSRHGRGGGWELIGGARTDLSGLSSDEARAIFLAAGTALGPAGIGTGELRSAMRKLTGALPETFRDDAAAAAAAIKIDGKGWGRIGRGTNSTSPQESEPLNTLTDAVISGRQVELFYDSASTDPGLRKVSPLGLVTKGNVWYLMVNTERGTRTYRLSRISNVTVLNQAVERPEGFDLDAAWEEIVIAVESQRAAVSVEAWVDGAMVSPVRWVFANQRTLETDVERGRFRMELGEVHVLALAAQLSGFGAAIELIDPSPELLVEMERIATELAERYLR